MSNSRSYQPLQMLPALSSSESPSNKRTHSPPNVPSTKTVLQNYLYQSFSAETMKYLASASTVEDGNHSDDSDDGIDENQYITYHQYYEKIGKQQLEAEERKRALLRMALCLLVPLMVTVVIFIKIFSVIAQRKAVEALSVMSDTHIFKAARSYSADCVSATGTENVDITAAMTQCPEDSTTSYCTDNTYPVLGGIDLVGTYYSYKPTSYHQSTAVKGTSDYESIYQGYHFYFSSERHQALFDKNPMKYLPQYGGFCAWAMATELCPNYTWSDTCLGPKGNWQSWTVLHGKLYFFAKKSSLDFFLIERDNNTVSAYTDIGDIRWLERFGPKPPLSADESIDMEVPTSSESQEPRLVLNTQCYLNK